MRQTQVNHLATYRAWAHSGFGIRNGDDRCLVSLPVFHAVGSNFCLYALLQGASVDLPRKFSPVATATALATGAVTRVPTMIDMLARDEAVAALDHRALRTIIYGGSTIPRTVLARAMAAFGCDLARCHAATETTAAATCLTAADHLGEDAPPASCGRAMAGTDLRIVDERLRVSLQGRNLFNRYHGTCAGTNVDTGVRIPGMVRTVLLSVATRF